VVAPTLAAETGRVRWVIAGLTLVVLVAVPLAMLLGPAAPPELPEPTLLARVNVCLNAGAGMCLLIGLWFVRHGQIAAHRRSMLTAFGLSSTFLVTYLIHHAQVGSVPFRGAGLWRPLYFGILIPHVVLAAVIVPLALLTLYRGWTGRVAAHRRIARYTFPLWLFVSLSGVAVYTMLYHVG
jgi:putative membrane protein